jgi:hypothetical protein
VARVGTVLVARGGRPRGQGGCLWAGRRWVNPARNRFAPESPRTRGLRKPYNTVNTFSSSRLSASRTTQRHSTCCCACVVAFPVACRRLREQRRCVGGAASSGRSKSTMALETAPFAGPATCITPCSSIIEPIWRSGVHRQISENNANQQPFTHSLLLRQEWIRDQVRATPPPVRQKSGAP